MELRLIASIDKRGGLGCKGDLLLRIPEDLRRFRSLTLGKSIIMGGTTFRSLPGALPLEGRRNIVLTHREDSIDGVEVVHSEAEALELLAGEDVAFVIGGQSVYELFLPYCAGAYLTHIEAELPEADTFLPKLPLEWKVLNKSDVYEFGDFRYWYAEYGIK